MRFLISVLVTVTSSLLSAAQVGQSVTVMNCVTGVGTEAPAPYVEKVIAEWRAEPVIAGIILDHSDQGRLLARSFFKGKLQAKGRKMATVEKHQVQQIFHDTLQKNQGCVVFRGTLKDFPELVN